MTIGTRSKCVCVCVCVLGGGVGFKRSVVSSCLLALSNTNSQGGVYCISIYPFTTTFAGAP